MYHIKIACIFLILLLFGCNDRTQKGTSDLLTEHSSTVGVPPFVDSIHISDHICVYDCLERSIDSNFYVREALVLNFNNSQNLPIMLSFEDTDFIDDGTGNDEEAGDGLYTSINTYSHSPNAPFVSLVRKSVFETVAVGGSFSHWQELEDYIPTYEDLPQKTSAKAGAGVNCEICTCSCSRCYCLACSVWGGFRCWHFCNCTVSVSIGVEWSTP